MAHTGPVKRLVAGLVAVLLSAGCATVDGTATVGDRDVDQAFFFADEIPTYGQPVDDDDIAMLATLRALRRVDVCGLVDQTTLAKIGELGSLATLYAFEECDFAVKLPGDAEPRFLTVILELTRPDQPESFRVGAVPVYPAGPVSCDYLVPFDLSRLPGASTPRGPDQPHLRVGMLGGQDCAVAARLATAVGQAISSGALPARDGAARYSVPLAEQDPCAVLAVLSDQVERWDIAESRPYTCEFNMRDDDGQVLRMRVRLQPKIVDIVSEDSEHRMLQDGNVLYLDGERCTATVFVGAAMQRRLAAGDFVDVDNVVVRPAVTVTGGAGDCRTAVGLAEMAPKLFG